MFRKGFRPDRAAPSVVGGTGITSVRNGREVYVEVSNSGTIHAVFSEGEEDPNIRSCGLSDVEVARLVAEMQEYLNG